jgi:peptidoglycan/xylan/chitin deacetylase (PgdA/CDA1 family)
VAEALAPGRVDYLPIIDRPVIRWPNGARVAFWVAPNIEHYEYLPPLDGVKNPWPRTPLPDVQQYSAHEYGNRVGFWRLVEVFDELNVTASLAINGSAIRSYEPISRAALERGWEFMGHGFTQKNMQKVENEREDIIKTREAIRAFTGKPPRGWLGPGLTETWETPDILVEEGFEYVADWVLDDQPVRLKTRTKPIVSVPYTQECNDVAMMLIQHHVAQEYRTRAIDQFEQIHSDSAKSARVMALVVHPYIMGAPHRFRYFREALQHMRARKDVAFWTGERICDWYLENSKAE